MGTPKSVFRKGADLLFGLVTIFCGLQLLFMVTIVVLQAFLRTFFKVSIKWGEEVVLIGMVWITFFTMSIGLRENLHIKIEFVTNALPRTLQKAVYIFSDLALLFVSVCMIYYGCILTKFTLASTLPATGLPSATTYGVVAVAGALCCLVMLGRLGCWLKGENPRAAIQTDKRSND